MGCNTCKQKGENKKNGIDKEIKLMPDAITNDNWGDMTFLLKIVVFAVITVAIPLVVVVLALQLFLHLFTPNFLNKIRNKWSNFVKKMIVKEKQFTHKKRVEKREKQFSSEDDFEDIVVEENNVVYEEK